MFRQYRRWLYLSLILSDVILINLAFAVAFWMRYDLQFLRAVDEANYIPYTEYIPIGLMLTVILIIICAFVIIVDNNSNLL